MSTAEPDTGWYPDGWVNPADDPELPWIEHPDPDQPDPVPPADRLAEEPGWDVEVADTGQHRRLARELGGEPEEAADGPRKFVQPGFGGLNLSDYSKLPSGKGWGLACTPTLATVRLSQAAVTVDARIAELVGLVMRACEARGYIFRKADTGAYNCRKIAGTSTWSNHAWALAIDVNWQSNPYTTAWVTDIPDWMHNLFNRYGFAWGGDYTGGKRDFMHFEFMGTPQQAQTALALARVELINGGDSLLAALSEAEQREVLAHLRLHTQQLCGDAFDINAAADKRVWGWTTPAGVRRTMVDLMRDSWWQLSARFPIGDRPKTDASDTIGGWVLNLAGKMLK